mmetsp:Transcript_5711/g.14916  ORF Transcript_5711/g.14916 Transcript_5711/m.14916 type:complete len:406 (+) Transcript_5711:1351-2568(+)
MSDVCSREERKVVSQRSALKSRWLVGSSSRSRSQRTKRAAARQTRTRQPPESVLTGCWRITASMPNPSRICVARASAESAERACRASSVAPSCLLSAGSVAGSAPSAPVAASSSARLRCSTRSSTSAFITVCSGVAASSSTPSCRTCTTRSTSGKPTRSYAEMALSSVVFPAPFWPSSPYLRPPDSRSEALSSSGRPSGASSVKFFTCTSREALRLVARARMYFLTAASASASSSATTASASVSAAARSASRLLSTSGASEPLPSPPPRGAGALAASMCVFPNCAELSVLPAPPMPPPKPRISSTTREGTSASSSASTIGAPSTLLASATSALGVSPPSAPAPPGSSPERCSSTSSLSQSPSTSSGAHSSKPLTSSSSVSTRVASATSRCTPARSGSSAATVSAR